MSELLLFYIDIFVINFTPTDKLHLIFWETGQIISLIWSIKNSLLVKS